MDIRNDVQYFLLVLIKKHFLFKHCVKHSIKPLLCSAQQNITKCVLNGKDGALNTLLCYPRVEPVHRLFYMAGFEKSQVTDVVVVV